MAFKRHQNDYVLSSWQYNIKSTLRSTFTKIKLLFHVPPKICGNFKTIMADRIRKASQK